MGTINKKSTFDTLVSALISGFAAGLPGGVRTVMVQGASTNNATVLTKLQSMAALDSAATAARAAASVAVSNRDQAMPANRAYVKSLVAALKVVFEGNNPALAALGITPPKPPKSPSGETRVIAKAKSKATRIARGTLGKQQRLALSATPLPTVVVAGLGAPAASSSTSSESAPSPASAPTAPAVLTK